MCYAALTALTAVCACCGERDPALGGSAWVKAPVCQWCRCAWYDGTDTNEPEEIAAVSRQMRAAGTVNIRAKAEVK